MYFLTIGTVFFPTVDLVHVWYIYIYNTMLYIYMMYFVGNLKHMVFSKHRIISGLHGYFE